MSTLRQGTATSILLPPPVTAAGAVIAWTSATPTVTIAKVGSTDTASASVGGQRTDGWLLVSVAATGVDTAGPVTVSAWGYPGQLPGSAGRSYDVLRAAAYDALHADDRLGTLPASGQVAKAGDAMSLTGAERIALRDHLHANPVAVASVAANVVASLVPNAVGASQLADSAVGKFEAALLVGGDGTDFVNALTNALVAAIDAADIDQDVLPGLIGGWILDRVLAGNHDGAGSAGKLIQDAAAAGGQAPAGDRTLTISVVEDDTGLPLQARVTLNAGGTLYHLGRASPAGVYSVPVVDATYQPLVTLPGYTIATPDPVEVSGADVSIQLRMRPMTLPLPTSPNGTIVFGIVVDGVDPLPGRTIGFRLKDGPGTAGLVHRRRPKPTTSGAGGAWSVELPRGAGYDVIDIDGGGNVVATIRTLDAEQTPIDEILLSPEP